VSKIITILRYRNSIITNHKQSTHNLIIAHRSHVKLLDVIHNIFYQ